LNPSGVPAAAICDSTFWRFLAVAFASPQNAVLLRPPPPPELVAAVAVVVAGVEVGVLASVAEEELEDELPQAAQTASVAAMHRVDAI
jgi:hypothetical protein